MEKGCIVYLTLALTDGFNIKAYKKVSVYFTVNYSHETLQYLPQIFL